MEENFLRDLGHRLCVLRNGKGLKQSEMAALMDLSIRNYQRYEHGEVNVPATTLNFFADFFGVSADYLLGRTEEP